MHFLDSIFETHTLLLPGVPLYVYAVRGEQGSVLVDTGIASMQAQILELCQEIGNLRYVLITHAHADHIGCNRAVEEFTGARFLAGGALPWIESLQTHYREFCLPDKLPDSPEQKAEILGLMDGPVHVDLLVGEGSQVRLGDGVELQTWAFPGHKLEEIGFLETRSKSLILGDLLLALAAPFFHGFQAVKDFCASLDKLEYLLHTRQALRVLSAHHPPLEPEQALKAIQQTRRFLGDVREATIDAASGVDFETLWQRVCQKLDKQLEFRGYAMLEVQVAELVAEGTLRQSDGLIARA